jgi:hypothetical protein
VADTIDIEDLTPDAGNVRRRTERSAEVITNSLKQFGAGRSIVLDKDGVVRAGNGTVDGAKAAGIHRVRVIESDGSELIAIKRTDLSGPEATAYAIADNRAADLSTWDFGDLDAQLGVLADAEFDIDAIGFNEDELARMFDKTQADEPDGPEEFPEVDDDIKTEHRCPKCGYEWSGKSS